MSKETTIKIDGMTCNNCSAGLKKYMEKQGFEKVVVNFSSGEVTFLETEEYTLENVIAIIGKMGYTLIGSDNTRKISVTQLLLISAFFTAPLFFGHFTNMLWGIEIPAFYQFLLALPVYIIGVWHFGRSAWLSLKTGVPNMDVLIFIGSTAAFFYSLVGLINGKSAYLFFETCATIITFVLIGNWIEKKAVQKTTTAIDDLQNLKPQYASRIMPSGAVVEYEVKDIKIGEKIRINNGDNIPADGVIIEGNANIDESLITGESIPIFKKVGQEVIGGSVIQDGSIDIEVRSIGDNSILGQIIKLVKNAQNEKPRIQVLADKISGVFVPVVLSISLLTFLVNYYGFDVTFAKSIMNSIAVLVISCPCAMGLATPTAVSVGVGRLAKDGILVKGGDTLETFGQIETFVFDKTGTLTTGKFKIDKIEAFGNNLQLIKEIIGGLELKSSHPIAKSIVEELEKENVNFKEFENLKEIRGVGISGEDSAGTKYILGSKEILSTAPKHEEATVFLVKDKELLAELIIKDELKPFAKQLFSNLNKKGVASIVLSGDSEFKTEKIANSLKATTYFSERTPQEKIDKITNFSAQKPTVMVGDGINDAAALSKANIGVSLGNASSVAIKSSDIILLNSNLEQFWNAFRVSELTFKTIKQNLFWAFAYNVVAIPVAAMGYLNPMWGAIFMAFSDVVVIGNSVRLKYKSI